MQQLGADRPLHLETANYRDFTRMPPDPVQLQRLRDDVRTGRDAAVLPEKYRTTYVTAPPLPRNYIERPVRSPVSEPRSFWMNPGLHRPHRSPRHGWLQQGRAGLGCRISLHLYQVQRKKEENSAGLASSCRETRNSLIQR